ncbi:DUF4270 family protein [Flavobacteriaceae bacterium S356]|uniref:DUF4270 family protein n=1 Tax=Asprobacillus argus TaxID=3076534 RepID=A0ABU3LDM3_9FLAO|nr:DUF4270 family protein [Flavobacteriaceae bacterium S356]
MLKKFIRRGAVLGSFALIISGVISCEKDFTDVNTSVIRNNEFTTNDTLLEVIITEKPVTSVRADGIQLGALGQYLLGSYNNPHYEKIEASIVSQLQISSAFKVVDREYGADTTVVTQIDTVYLKLPYQATLQTDGTYELDSIIGDTEKAFNLNIYQNTTFLNVLDPSDPSVFNQFQSDAIYQTLPTELNAISNFQYIPRAGDTMMVVSRKLNTGSIYDKDTIKLTNSLPFGRVPLKADLLKQILLDRYQTDDFASQEAFDDYFRGIVLEASEGTDPGSLISFSFNTGLIEYNPSIEVYYTNTVLVSGVAVDTIKKNDSFRLFGVRNSLYNMTTNNPTPAGNFQIQGTAGTHADIALFGPDTDGNGLPDQMEELRAKNWLINDAQLTFYVNQNIVGFDTIATPFRLFLYKNGESLGLPPALIKDALPETSAAFGGVLELTDEKKPDKYTFRITDYISDILSGATNYSPPLTLKVANPTDFPTTATDTIIDSYNWNPKGVMLLNHLLTNGDRRVQLKISYSEKTTN